ncbi:hypothetical protein D1F64_02790 [Breoghania sp. L-A4]|nr:hypothetical protein D1F64_02790 [Breoghania sp. L-A4]
MFVVAVGIGLTAVALVPPARGAVAVFVPPWASESGPMSIIAAANGRFMRTGSANWVFLATSEEPGFADRLYAAGAWIVANPIVAGGCVAERG